MDLIGGFPLFRFGGIEESPDTPGQDSPRKRGHVFREERVTDSATENKPSRIRGIRVKRWGKSPPPGGRPTGHGKPNPVQGEIGNRAARLTVPGTSRPAPAGIPRSRDR